MNPINNNEIPTAILATVGNITKMTFPKQGCTSDVAILDGLHGQFVLKRAKIEQFRTWLAREVFVLNSLSQTVLPVPNVFRFVEENNQSWVLMEFFQGQTLRDYLARERDPENRHQAIFNFGKILTTLHATECPNELKSEELWLDELLERAQYNLDHYQVDGSQELLDQLMKDKPAPYKQTLIHGDFTIDNVLVHEGEIIGVIDWSGGAYGDPRYDAALAIRPKRNAFETDEDKESFFEGYGKKFITKQDYEYFENGLYEFF
ncbi:phosphotransferase family protein [Alkalihalobacillus sp. AL-G]|uniref:phosphotransferase family protein n=1 Tax=Alkalihalobacillus sp. AL-G TaxID=2926399 RepID=UPI00272BC3BF|nr:phosphotransferase [Alkalihalobacillus sp. AL-G]WLD94704.1 phosphotransferase [Alkalihalobacillus sp. AL-G]